MDTTQNSNKIDLIQKGIKTWFTKNYIWECVFLLSTSLLMGALLIKAFDFHFILCDILVGVVVSAAVTGFYLFPKLEPEWKTLADKFLAMLLMVWVCIVLVPLIISTFLVPMACLYYILTYPGVPSILDIAPHILILLILCLRAL
jgi:hypothetical protein